jgi:hypothetical protein
VVQIANEPQVTALDPLPNSCGRVQTKSGSGRVVARRLGIGDDVPISASELLRLGAP